MEEDQLTTIALEAGAEDLRTEGKTYEVITEPSKLEEAKKILLQKQMLFMRDIINLTSPNYRNLKKLQP